MDPGDRAELESDTEDLLELESDTGDILLWEGGVVLPHMIQNGLYVSDEP